MSLDALPVSNLAKPVIPAKPRAFVLTDIGNEPDDQMSLTRLLLYSNEIDVGGLVAVTSTWQKAKVSPEIIENVIAHYGQVQPNLLKHAEGYPTEQKLREIVRSGQPVYGMAALDHSKLSTGAALLIEAADRSDPRPLHVGIWGGANVLAEALLTVKKKRSSAQVDQLISKLRVYSISDQDDAGPWLRREFPNLFYIVKPSTLDGQEYAAATWTGIGGDQYYRNAPGADFTTVTNEWLDRNIRSKGPFGKAYPKYIFIMEGDTPSFLSLVNNGLAADQNPGWGGWGGRYIYRQPYGETHPIWTQGGDAFPGTPNSRDTVVGIDGNTYTSDQATIWRWRTAFQHDFAARMDWTVKPFAEANHNPTVVVNGEPGTAPIRMNATAGTPVHLDAAGTTDPDGNQLGYHWFAYPEAGTAKGITVAGNRGPQADVIVSGAGEAHIILVVEDDGSPSLTSYRRIILNVR